MQRTHKEGKQLGYHEHCSEGLTWMSIDYTNIILRFRCEILISFVLVTIWPFYCYIKMKSTVSCRVRCRLKFGFLLENLDFDFLSRLPSAVKRRDTGDPLIATRCDM